MEPTLVRQHDTVVMVVGPSGRNADRVTAALEQARVKVVRVGSSPVACEKLANSMPQVVILVAPTEPPHREELSDRAGAVGAILMDVDEHLDGDEYEDVVNDIITTAITRKMARDDVEPSSDDAEMRTETKTEPPHGLPVAGDEVDDGWDD